MRVVPWKKKCLLLDVSTFLGPLLAGNTPATTPKGALSPNQNRVLSGRGMPDPIRKVPVQPAHPFFNDPLQVDKA